VAKNPSLAVELRIGRPDLQQSFDDGGLVDVNHVPAKVLAALPGLNEEIAEKIVSQRDGVGGFTSSADLEVTLGIPPVTLDEARDRLMFRSI
jgi:DNA uptake protein ComE-like DNA-binding protein